MSGLLEAAGISVPGRLHPTDLQLSAGSITALIGPNGGGKTSLLRAIARIERPGGRVWIGGEEVDGAPPARRVQLLSFLPAARDILWPIQVRDLILLGPRQPSSSRLDQLLDVLELHALADRRADQLSTGERTRVLLARALVGEPSVLLLDEPLSNLDPYWVLRILEVLQSCASEGSAVLVALHDLALLNRVDRALLVADGKIRADGAPGDVLQGSAFESAFRVRRNGEGWAISPEADPRSSR